MSVSLRMRRMGRRKHPIFGLVAADSRSPRDGKYIEDLGRYEPVAEPATVTLAADRIVYWLSQGAQPSDTVRNLLQKEGILLQWALTRQGKEAEEIETEVAAFKERRAEKAASSGKKTRAERRADALAAERAAAKEKAAELAKERADREAELQRQREEAEASARAEAEAAREEAAAAAADSEALTEAADAPAATEAATDGDAVEQTSSQADGDTADQQAEAEAEGGDAAAEEASADAVAEEAPDAAEEQPAAEDDTAAEVADDAGAAMADQTETGAEEADTVTEEPATEAPDVDGNAGEPATGSEPPAADDSAEADDLTDVSGIGPKYSGILTDAGITTFAQLAETSVERIQEIITEAGSTTAGNEETWPEQAKLLAAGDTEGHEAYLESQK